MTPGQAGEVLHYLSSRIPTGRVTLHLEDQMRSFVFQWRGRIAKMELGAKYHIPLGPGPIGYRPKDYVADILLEWDLRFRQ